MITKIIYAAAALVLLCASDAHAKEPINGPTRLEQTLDAGHVVSIRDKNDDEIGIIYKNLDGQIILSMGGKEKVIERDKK